MRTLTINWLAWAIMFVCLGLAQKLPPDYKRELLNVVGENDMVVIYVRQTWTGRDGKHNQALGFDMFRVQDGKIAEHWDAD